VQPVSPSSHTEALIEGKERGGRRISRREKDAAVGQLETGLRPQSRKPGCRVRPEPQLFDAKGLKRGHCLLQASSSGRSHEHLCVRDRAGPQRVIGQIEEDPFDRIVVGVAGIEVRDQGAGVGDDHSGQSRRRLSR